MIRFLIPLLLRERERVLRRQRDYYRRNRDKVLAWNRASKERHGHRWKSCSAEYRRQFPFKYHPRPPRSAICVDCGAFIPSAGHAHYRKPIPGKLSFRIYRCDKCHWDLMDEFIQGIEKPTRRDFEFDRFRREHFFDFDPSMQPEPPDPNLEEMLRKIDTVFVALTPRQQAILHLRYDEGLTLERIAQTFGITRERVRQILAKIHRAFRAKLREMDAVERVTSPRP